MKKILKKILTCDHQKIAFILVLIFVISLLPILYLSGYVYATGDDYGYGARTHIVWLETQSLWQTLKTAAETSVYYWYGWQGTWFTIFLMALQPEVFWDNGYWIVPWLMLTITIFSTSLLLHYFFVKKLELSWKTWLSVDILLLLCMIQYFPSTKSGIFWYNGAVHYIVPYCLALLAIYSFFKFLDTKKSRYVEMAAICMFCLGGSSYLAPLLVLIILFYLLVADGRKKKYMFWLLIPATIEIVGLAVSFLAPGNRKRGGEEFGIHGLLILKTIGNCFLEGSKTVLQYMNEEPVVFLCLLGIAFLVFEAFMKAETEYRFSMPVVFAALMFCTYSAMFAPAIYAGVEVSGGVPNTIYQVFLLTSLMSILYMVGWLASKCRKSWESYGLFKLRCFFVSIFLAVCLLMIGARGTLKDSTFYKCYEFLVSGRADDYKVQMEERLKILRDTEQMEVELPAMNADQGPIMHMEVMEDPDAWTNTVVRQFFRKESVVRIPRT